MYIYLFFKYNFFSKLSYFLSLNIISLISSDEKNKRCSHIEDF